MHESGLKLHNVTEVCKILGLSSTTFWRLRKTGGFPKPIEISGNLLGWPEKTITEWVEEEFKKAQK